MGYRTPLGSSRRTIEAEHNCEMLYRTGFWLAFAFTLAFRRKMLCRRRNVAHAERWLSWLSTVVCYILYSFSLLPTSLARDYRNLAPRVVGDNPLQHQLYLSIAFCYPMRRTSFSTDGTYYKELDLTAWSERQNRRGSGLRSQAQGPTAPFGVGWNWRTPCGLAGAVAAGNNINYTSFDVPYAGHEVLTQATSGIIRISPPPSGKQHVVWSRQDRFWIATLRSGMGECRDGNQPTRRGCRCGRQ